MRKNAKLVDSEFLSQLNEQQREAVLATEGPLLILAGAGSGKTRVIAHRIAYLIAEKNVPTWNILAVTFTNKAADEMRQRVQRLLHARDDSSLPLVSTFHSLCVRILRQDIEKLNDNYTRRFTIYDQDDSLRLFGSASKTSVTMKSHSASAAYNLPSVRRKTAAKIQRRSQHAPNTCDERRAAIARVYQMYEDRLHANNALDFDDLLIKTVRLLRNVPEVREKYNNKFRYILVDEYQDTNSLQFALISLITQKQQNIAVVGDEDQSIYKWRGADISNILNFESHFREHKDHPSRTELSFDANDPRHCRRGREEQPATQRKNSVDFEPARRTCRLLPGLRRRSGSALGRRKDPRASTRRVRSARRRSLPDQLAIARV